jgi:MFS family permease
LLLGGVITSGLGWQWIFLINIPIGLLILVLCPLLVRESRPRARSRRFDVAGAVTISAALVLLLVGVTQAPDVGWAHPRTLILLTVAAALVALFGLIEARSADPLAPPRIFRMRTLLAGNAMIFAVGMAVDGMLFPLTLYAQQVLGFSALQFGLASAVMTVMSIAGALAGQALVTRIGMRPVAVAAMILILTGSLLLIPVSVGGTSSTTCSGACWCSGRAWVQRLCRPRSPR